jgi:hypothetical protein
VFLHIKASDLLDIVNRISLVDEMRCVWLETRTERVAQFRYGIINSEYITYHAVLVCRSASQQPDNLSAYNLV